MYYEAMELTVQDETVLVYVDQYSESVFTTNVSRGTCEYFRSPMDEPIGYLLTILMRAERIEWIDPEFESADDLQEELLEICDRGLEADHINALFNAY